MSFVIVTPSQFIIRDHTTPSAEYPCALTTVLDTHNSDNEHHAVRRRRAPCSSTVQRQGHWQIVAAAPRGNRQVSIDPPSATRDDHRAYHRNRRLIATHYLLEVAYTSYCPQTWEARRLWPNRTVYTCIRDANDLEKHLMSICPEWHRASKCACSFYLRSFVLSSFFILVLAHSLSLWVRA